MENLPIEICEAITGYLTNDELAALIGVNSFFLNLGLNARYSDMDINTGDKDAKDQIRRVL